MTRCVGFVIGVVLGTRLLVMGVGRSPGCVLIIRLGRATAIGVVGRVRGIRGRVVGGVVGVGCRGMAGGVGRVVVTLMALAAPSN